MAPAVLEQLPQRFRSRCRVVGDLMADLSDDAKGRDPLPDGEWVALLRGFSRQVGEWGCRFCWTRLIVWRLSRPGCRFLLPVAPTTNPDARSSTSPVQPIPIAAPATSAAFAPGTADAQSPWRRLLTEAGTVIHLQEDPPAHGALSQCALASPPWERTPQNRCSRGSDDRDRAHPASGVMQAWDGWLGLLAKDSRIALVIGFLLSAWRMRTMVCGLAEYFRGRSVVARACGGDHA